MKGKSMVLSDAEVAAIRALLHNNSDDYVCQMSRFEIAEYAKSKGVEDPVKFVEKCLMLGLRDEDY